MLGQSSEPNANKMKLALPSLKESFSVYMLDSIKGVFTMGFIDQRQGGNIHLLKGEKLKRSA